MGGPLEGCTSTDFSVDPVFFASQCGKKQNQPNHLSLTEDVEEWRTASVGAAVEFARANNLLGIFVDADLLVMLLVGKVFDIY